MAANKTIYVDKDGKKIIVIGDPKKKRLGKNKLSGEAPGKPEPKPQIEPQIDPKTKRPFKIKSTGSTESMGDALKIEGKPHSSPEGRFMSKLRSRPLEIKMANGGKVRKALRGGGRAYGKNS